MASSNYEDGLSGEEALIFDDLIHEGFVTPGIVDKALQQARSKVGSATTGVMVSIVDGENPDTDLEVARLTVRVDRTPEEATIVFAGVSFDMTVSQLEATFLE